jgi:AcrR family transcriptional regulator
VAALSQRVASGRAAPVTARGQATRRRLLDAAETVFGELGYERASISEVTRLAGVAQGTFYLYYPNKKAIFVELVEDLGHRLRRHIAEAVRGGTDRLEVERLGFEAFFDFIGQHRDLYRIVRQAEFVDEQVYQRYYRRLAERYARGLASAAAGGQVAAQLDPESLAYCLMGMGDFLGMRWVLWEGRPPPARAIEALLALVRQGMAVTDPAVPAAGTGPALADHDPPPTTATGG